MKGAVVTDTYTRTLATGWGSTDAPNPLAWSVFFGGTGTYTATDTSTNGTAGLHSVPIANAYRASYLATFAQTYADVKVDASVAVMPVGGSLELGNLMTRGTSITTYNLFRVQISPAGVVSAVIFNPGGTNLGTITIPGVTYTAGMVLRIRAQSIGQVHRIKVWPVAAAEPVAWPLTVVDSTPAAAGWVGIRSGVASGVTNAMPVVFTYDNFRVAQVPDFPNDQLPLTVLAAFGADLSKDPSTWPWQDITADVRTGVFPVITQGRKDETSQAAPASCTFTLNNDSKAYSAYNGASPNFPNVKRNTPIWVIIDPATRFAGYAGGFTPFWDTSGKMAMCRVNADGILRRIMQGKTPVASPMRHAILAANPVAYWTLEDQGGQVSSALPNGGTLATPPLGTWNFAAESTLLGSAPAATLTATSTFAAPVAGTFHGNWQVDWHTRIPSIPSAQETIMMRTLTGGSGSSPVAWWDFVIGNDGGGNYQAVHGYNNFGTLVVDSGHFACNSWQVGQWNHYRLMARQNGANVEWRLVEFPIFGVGGFLSGSFGGTVGGVVSLSLPANPALNGVALSHLAVWDAWDFSATDQASKGFGPDPFTGTPGELVTTRLSRVCGEAGIPLTIIGTSSVTMGPQPVDVPLNILRECEAADMGLLYDGATFGLTYLCRSSRYNQPAAMTADMALHQVDDPFAPVDDDQRNRNKYKVDRKGGSSATYEDKTGPLGTDPAKGIGVYDSSPPGAINIDSDVPLSDYAAWLTHLGTVIGFRYPLLSFDLGNNPELIDGWVGARLNSRIDILNVDNAASGHTPGTMSLLNEGYTENLGPKTWDVKADCSPELPWRVFVLDQDRLEADASSQLVADITATATTFQVQTAATPGALWTTDATEWNGAPKVLYINMAGEQMQVTNIAGSVSPQTFTVVRSVNGMVKTQKAGAFVGIWQPRVLAL